MENHDYPPSPWLVNRIQNSISGSGPSRSYNLFIKYFNYEPRLIGGEPVTNWSECPRFVIDPMPIKLVLPGEERNSFFGLKSVSSEMDILMFLSVLSQPQDYKFNVDVGDAEVILMKFGRDRISVSGHALIRMKRTGFVDIVLGRSRKRVYLNRVVNL